MIGDRVNIQEQRSIAALAIDQIDRPVKIEAVGFEVMRAEITHIQIVLNSRRRLKGARPEKRPVKRIKTESPVTALVQQTRQPAIDVIGRDPRHGGGKASEGSDRKAGEHIVFGEPAWSADPLHDQLAFLPVERLKMTMIPVRHLDPGRRSDVEARFIVQQDDMRELPWGMTDEAFRCRQPSAGVVGCLQISTNGYLMKRLDGCPRKFRNVAFADKILAQIGRAAQGYGNESQGGYREAR